MATDRFDQYCNSEPDVGSMTVEEIRASIEANSPPLNSFSLHNHEGRLGFLRELFMRGYPALFQGVSHVWSLLEEPKAARCFGIGLAAGTGGTGKAALVKFLSRMIKDALETISDIPPIDDFSSLHDWNEAAKESWHTDEVALSVVLEKYARLIVAHPFGTMPTHERGKVIGGPWEPDEPAEVGCGGTEDHDPA